MLATTPPLPPTAADLAQYDALTAGVGLAELASRTLIELTGRDRVAFLNSFTTGDVKKLPTGRGCEAFVTSPQGKTLGHVLILARDDSLLVWTVPSQAAALVGHLERYIISEDVVLCDRSDQWSTLLVAGAGSVELLQRATGIMPRAEPVAWIDCKLADLPVTAVRAEYAGPASFLLLTRVEHAPRVALALEQAGAVRASDAAVEMARLEAGMPLFGRDITDENLPQEIGRDNVAISFTKGCYLGQETVARIDALGHVNRQLVGVQFASTAIPPAGTQLAAGGKQVGHVTSAAWSPKLAAPLAMALVRRAQAKPGTPLSSEHSAAVVVALPV